MNQEASRPVSRQISELSPIFARTKKNKLMGNSPKYSPPPTVAGKIYIVLLKLWESATELSSLKSFHCTDQLSVLSDIFDSRSKTLLFCLQKREGFLSYWIKLKVTFVCLKDFHYFSSFPPQPPREESEADYRNPHNFVGRVLDQNIQ